MRPARAGGGLDQAYARIGNAYGALKQYDDAVTQYDLSLMEDYDEKVRVAAVHVEGAQ